MLDTESLFVMQLPGLAEPVQRKGESKLMPWSELLEKKQAVFASEFASEQVYALVGASEHEVWPDLEEVRKRLDPPAQIPLSAQDFAEQVEWVKKAISQGAFEKLVLARSHVSAAENDASLEQQFRGLCERHKQALSFVYYQPDLGLWIGSTPEHLLQWEAGKGRILAMAGTLNSGEHWSAKEELEQSVTGRFIEELLNGLSLSFEVDALDEVQYGSLRHLRSEYSFEIEAERLPELLLGLNPTPAVAGYSQGAALRALKEHIPFERGAYSGVLGTWRGNRLEAWVQLRCARVYGNQTCLYAGAGINLGSDPQKEWLETEFKMNSLGI